MLKKIFTSFILALHNVRSHFFHTLLSILGIVIGVAALVSILSLIDGMEQYANDQITRTTSLKMIMVKSEPLRYLDGVSIRKDSVTTLNYRDLLDLQSSLTLPAKAQLFTSANQGVTIEDDSSAKGAYVAATAYLDTTQIVQHGRKYNDQDLASAAAVAVISESLARSWIKQGDLSILIGKKIKFGDNELKVIGIVKHATHLQSCVFLPITYIPEKELKKYIPLCTIEAVSVEDVPELKEEVSAWIKSRFGEKNDFSIATNGARVEQAANGFKLFRIIMGLIVGISVLVGGIGVMNVLLISVTERTTEIGVRKAVGANKRDIVMQFLSESIAISLIGSFMGLVIGILATMIIVPVVKSLTDIPFQAAYTWNTLFVISILAVFIGVLFGTYPAMRAARLDPVEAIRKNE